METDFTPLHHGAAQSAAACASGSSWLRAARGASIKPSILTARVAAAATCFAHGEGRWVALPEDATEPYLVDPAVRMGRREAKWFGRCDADINEKNRSLMRPARPAVRWRWEPTGNGCAALQGEPTSGSTSYSAAASNLGDAGHKSAPLPPLGALACAFCARWAGRAVLFVGDSVQGELLTLASVQSRALPP